MHRPIEPPDEPEGTDHLLPGVPDDPPGPTEDEAIQRPPIDGGSGADREADAATGASRSQDPETDRQRDEPDQAEAGLDPGAQPAGPRVTTLEEYLAVEKGEELPRRLFRHMAAENRARFSRDEQRQALAILTEAD